MAFIPFCDDGSWIHISNPDSDLHFWQPGQWAVLSLRTTVSFPLTSVLFPYPSFPFVNAWLIPPQGISNRWEDLDALHPIIWSFTGTHCFKISYSWIAIRNLFQFLQPILLLLPSNQLWNLSIFYSSWVWLHLQRSSFISSTCASGSGRQQKPSVKLQDVDAKAAHLQCALLRRIQPLAKWMSWSPSHWLNTLGGFLFWAVKDIVSLLLFFYQLPLNSPRISCFLFIIYHVASEGSWQLGFLYELLTFSIFIYLNFT